MLHNFFFFPADTHRDDSRTKYCTVQILFAYGSCASGKGTPRSGDTDRTVDMRMQVLTAHSFTPWVALVIHDIHLPCGNGGGAAALTPLVSHSGGSC